MKVPQRGGGAVRTRMEKLPVLDHVVNQAHTGKNWEPHLRIREVQGMFGSSYPMIVLEQLPPHVLEVLQGDVH